MSMVVIIRRLSDVIEDREELGEEFDLDVSSCSDDEEPPAKTATVPAPTVAMSELQLLKLRIAQLEELENLKGKKETSASKSKKKELKNTATFASGLRPAYYNTTTTTTPRSPPSTRADSPDNFGGLNDDDLDDVRPTASNPILALSIRVPTQNQLATLTRGLPRNTHRANKEVAVVTQDPFQQAPAPVSRQHAPTIPPRSQRRTPTPPVRHHQERALATSQPQGSRAGSQQQTPAPRATTTRRPRATLQRHETFISVEPVAVRAENSRSRLSANAVRANDLPSFVDLDNRWKEVYLPTLYHTFYLSTETFAAFKVSSRQFIETVQDVVDLVYPYKDYTVSGVGDPIVLMSYNRINGARSSIASDAMKEIQEHLRKTYAGKLGDAYEWLLWARCLEYGPLFFEKPTPFQLINNPEDPAFVYPSGRLRSPFLLSVVRIALDGIDGTMKDRNLIPGGLFALAMGALERAVRSLKPDGSCDTVVQTNFCQAKWGEAVAGYSKGFSTVSLAKWTVILSLCQDIPDSQDPFERQEARIIQRVNIFNFESPTK